MYVRQNLTPMFRFPGIPITKKRFVPISSIKSRRKTRMMRAAQKAELEKTLWRTANELRGHVDGWDFKSYVLGMLFYRCISENLTHFIHEGERVDGDADCEYSRITVEQAGAL